MSRIAEARIRAGYAPRSEEEAVRWDSEREAAAELLAPPRPKPSIVHSAPAAVPPPAPRPKRRAPRPRVERKPPAPEADLVGAGVRDVVGESLVGAGLQARPQTRRPSVDTRPKELVVPPTDPYASEPELTDTIRHLFLASKRPVRSLLFCTAPGEPMSDVSWRAAEILTAVSSRRVAFVEDGANSVAPRDRSADGLITRIGWYADDAGTDIGGTASRIPPYEGNDTGGTASRIPPYEDPDPGALGGSVAELLAHFDFVIANATADAAEDLVPLASEVDGVIVLISDQLTRRESATALVETLRAAGVHLLGVVFVSPEIVAHEPSATGLSLRG